MLTVKSYLTNKNKRASKRSYCMVDLSLDLTVVNLEQTFSQPQLVTGITSNFVIIS